MKTLLLLLTLATACTTESSPTIQPRIIAPGDALTLAWSIGQDRACEDCAPRWPVDCGHEISHPCPYALFTTKLSIEGACAEEAGTCAVWGSATGGSDANGNPAENHAPWVDAFTLDGEKLVVTQRGDDGGLRHATELHPVIFTNGAEHVADGYTGDIEWSLFNEAGYTTFHVDLTFEGQ